jgi:hypothetical protein
LNDSPKLHELDLISGDKCQKVQLIKELAAEWEKIAIRLHFESHHIKRIQRDNRSSEDCCRSVFMDWLEGTGRQPISWKVMVEAVSEGGFSRVAKDLKSILHN